MNDGSFSVMNELSLHYAPLCPTLIVQVLALFHRQLEVDDSMNTLTMITIFSFVSTSMIGIGRIVTRRGSGAPTSSLVGYELVGRFGCSVCVAVVGPE